jgi:BASS family bile acid:Na+ symporter
MLKSVFILVALATGLLLPQLDAYTFVLRPFLMTLLFFSFLGVNIDREIFARQQLLVAVLLPFIGLLAYWLGGLYNEDLALTLLLMGLAPTAVISPVLAELMHRRAAYMIGAILLTHASFALTVPLLLPYLLGVELVLADLGKLLLTISSTILLPLALAQVLRRWNGEVADRVRRCGPYAFGLFLINVAVASGSLSHYLRYESDTPWSFIWLTTAAITAMVILNFLLGSRIAPPDHAVEGSLTLGRKNTMLSIWIALEFINPLVVLGPMLYILGQNVLVAGQILLVAKRDGEVVHQAADA